MVQDVTDFHYRIISLYMHVSVTQQALNNIIKKYSLMALDNPVIDAGKLLSIRPYQFNYLFNGFPYPIFCNIEKNLNVTNCAYPLKKGGELIDFCIKSIKYSAIYKYAYIKDLIVLVAMGFLTKSL